MPPKEIYIVNPNHKADLINPERNVSVIPVEHKFKCTQSGEAGKVIYIQTTKYFKDSLS